MPPKVVYPCIECKKPVTKSTGGINCSYCELWIHTKCGNFSKEHIKTLKELPGASWNCKPCEIVSRKVALELKNLNLKTYQLRVDVDKNTEDHVKQKEWNQTMAKRVENLSREKVNNDAVFEELREHQKRSRNLVIHQVTEPPSSMTVGMDRQNHDIAMVIEILDFLKVPTRKEDIKFIYRPGDRSEVGRPRPAILCLKDQGAKDYILANSRELAKTKFNHISIIPDLTQQQRREEDRMRKLADKRNSEMDPEEALNWEWVTVGIRGERELIKRKIFGRGGQGEVRRGDQRGQKSNRTPVGPETLTGANSQVIQPRRASQRGLVRHEPRIDSTALTQDQRESTILQHQPPTIVRGLGLTDSGSVILEESSEDDPLMEDELPTNKILEPEKQKHTELPSSDEEEEDLDINNQTESIGRETREHKKRPRPDKSISPTSLQHKRHQM